MTSEAIGKLIAGVSADVAFNHSKGNNQGALAMMQVAVLGEIALQLAVMNERNAAKDAAAVHAPGFEWTPPIGNIMEPDPQS